MGLFVVIGLMSLVGMYVQGQLKSKFTKYSQIPNPAQKSGAEIAYEMLVDNGLDDVRIVEGQGFLTDHYDPRNRTITLSPAIYRGGSVMAAAVAAHETGHAIQHATAYNLLRFRSAMVPVVKVAASVQQWMLLAALFLASTFPQLMLIVMLSFLVTTLFSLVTLPVEFDASSRAVNWLESSGNAVSQSLDGAKDALKWAGMTYVAQALSSLIMLLFLFLNFRD